MVTTHALWSNTSNFSLSIPRGNLLTGCLVFLPTKALSPFYLYSHKMVSGWAASAAYKAIFKELLVFFKISALLQCMGILMDRTELSVIQWYHLTFTFLWWSHSCLMDRCPVVSVWSLSSVWWCLRSNKFKLGSVCSLASMQKSSTSTENGGKLRWDEPLWRG